MEACYHYFHRWFCPPVELSLPIYDLFAQVMQLSSSFITVSEIFDLSRTNKNSNLLCKKIQAEKKLKCLIENELNSRIDSIYQIKNLKGIEHEESKLSEINSLESIIDNSFDQLGIIKNDFLECHAKKCIMDYFSRKDRIYLTNIQSTILNELANDFMDKKQVYEILKIVKEIPVGFKPELIKTIFHGFMEMRFLNQLEKDCDFKKNFIKILFQEKDYDKVLNFAVAYEQTPHQYEIVQYVLIHLFLRGQIKRAASFILKSFGQLNYLLIIPKLYLSQDRVQSAINFAKLTEKQKCFDQQTLIDPYLTILKVIINDQIQKGKFQEAWDVVPLIKSETNREFFLGSIMEKCLIHDELALFHHMANTLTISQNKIKADDLILNYILNKCFTESQLYQDLNVYLTTIPNSIDRLGKIQLLIRQAISDKNFDLAPYRYLFLDFSKCKDQISEIDIYKFLVMKYLELNRIFAAVDFAKFLPSLPFADRSIYYFRILDKILCENLSDIEKETNLHLAIRLMGVIDNAKIMREAKKKFDPVIKKFAQQFNFVYEWKNPHFQKANYNLK